MARERWDDKVVDLCTALECLLAEQGDRRKAEAIAVRYLLLRIATGDENTPTHPFDLYDLYLLRNEIVHGSGHSVSTKQDYRDLKRTAVDALERFCSFASAHPEVKSVGTMLRAIETDDGMDLVASFVSRFPDKEHLSIMAYVEDWQQQRRQERDGKPGRHWGNEMSQRWPAGRLR